VKEMEDCVFCGIVNKNIPANIVYEDEQVLAFHDLHPIAPVHVLIIPKKHIARLNEATESDEALLGHILLAANEIASSLGIAESGFRLVNNCGQDGGQVIYHLHFHLLGGKDLGSKIA
jgi:histidine triad (HIT) family protein